MEFRRAVLEDLPQLKSMYGEIIEHMEKAGLAIWDDVYPCSYLEADIERGELYLLQKEGEILSAFALCSSNAGETAIQWEKYGSKALYLDRFGVNATYARKGIGSLMLERAKDIANTLGAEYLRLFVVESNVPAQNLYEKNGFSQGRGIYEERIEADYVLREYGYEIKL